MVQKLLSKDDQSAVNSALEEVRIIADDLKYQNNVEFLNGLIKHLRIELFELSLKSKAGHVGAYLKSDETEAIFIDSNLSAEEKIYTVAHELGHKYLDGKTAADPRLWFRMKNKGEEKNQEPSECRADEFAERLLLPWKNLEPILFGEGKVIPLWIIEKIAAKFMVPKDVVKSRLTKEGFKCMST